MFCVPGETPRKKSFCREREREREKRVGGGGRPSEEKKPYRASECPGRLESYPPLCSILFLFLFFLKKITHTHACTHTHTDDRERKRGCAHKRWIPWRVPQRLVQHTRRRRPDAAFASKGRTRVGRRGFPATTWPQQAERNSTSRRTGERRERGVCIPSIRPSSVQMVCAYHHAALASTEAPCRCVRF